MTFFLIRVDKPTAICVTRRKEGKRRGVTAQATTKTTCNIYLCEKTMAQGEVEGSHGGGKRKKKYCKAVRSRIFALISLVRLVCKARDRKKL